MDMMNFWPTSGESIKPKSIDCLDITFIGEENWRTGQLAAKMILKPGK
jgi:hypothetical protein